MALLSLQSLRNPSGAGRAALSDGIAWLKGAQKRNGAFGGGPSTKANNTNSTGLAASALAERRRLRRGAAGRPVGRQPQLTGRLSGTPLAGEQGAIAYNGTGLTAGPESRDPS